MNNTINKILTLAIVASVGFSSCKKQKDDLDLGGTRGGEKTYDCPTLKKNYREECTTEAGVKGFVNADCECQQRNVESDDRVDDKEGRDKMGDGRKKDKKDRRKKRFRKGGKKKRGDRDRDKNDERDRDDEEDKDDENDGEDEERDNTGRG